MQEDIAAEVLLTNWRNETRIASLPEDCRPGTRAEGYQVAARVAELSGSAIAGWKIAATSKAGQRHINVDSPLIGRILSDKLKGPGAQVPLGNNIMRVAEAEFAFAFGQDLPPRASEYTIDEALEAVSALHLSIEVPDSRYVDFTKVGAPSLIADTACACWLVLGPAIETGWRELDLANHVVIARRNGDKVAEGSGRAVLGDPRLALTWFVNEAARYCGGVRKGQFVTTGTCIVPAAIAPGDSITINYGRLGSIDANIA